MRVYWMSFPVDSYRYEIAILYHAVVNLSSRFYET
jgi:hypothetical protein